MMAMDEVVIMKAARFLYLSDSQAQNMVNRVAHAYGGIVSSWDCAAV